MQFEQRISTQFPHTWLKNLASLLPFFFLPTFDEITTTYKTPFIVTCALLLCLGFIAHQRSRQPLLRWLILLTATIGTIWAALHATDAFWQMTSNLGYRECFPDYTGCAPLTGSEPPWWQLFFQVRHEYVLLVHLETDLPILTSCNIMLHE